MFSGCSFHKSLHSEAMLCLGGREDILHIV